MFNYCLERLAGERDLNVSVLISSSANHHCFTLTVCNSTFNFCVEALCGLMCRQEQVASAAAVSYSIFLSLLDDTQCYGASHERGRAPARNERSLMRSLPESPQNSLINLFAVVRWLSLRTARASYQYRRLWHGTVSLPRVTSSGKGRVSTTGLRGPRTAPPGD